MTIHTIDTGYFKLDGGAMFGVVPRRLWQRLHAPDENNMCTLSMRCLLIEMGDRKILIDTGIGDKQDAKFRSHFEPHGAANLLASLKQKGVQSDDITDVLLTHFHFDHAGGAVSYNADGDLVPTFSKAIYWTNQQHYDWAINPNTREKASFLKENFVPLQEQGVLRMIPTPNEIINWLPGIDLHLLYGHTEAMMMPVLTKNGKKIYYGVDLLPTSFHVSMPFVMSYDVRPLKTLEEKKVLYQQIVDNPDAAVVFEHDPKVEAATLIRNEKGRVVIGAVVDPTSFLSD
ncbi:MAG: MBL fold metallo-hydrolase [Saprospiraceae bacterium]